MRGKKAIKPKIKPDSKYNNIHVAKFINYLMSDGKKTTAQAVLYDAFDIIDERIEQKQLDKNENPDALAVFEKAIKNVTPQLEVRGRRIGGANYQIPMQVRGDRRFYLAAKWLIDASAAKKGKAMAERLAAEFIDATNNEGAAVKKKSDVHRMAEANRAFAHFAR